MHSFLYSQSRPGSLVLDNKKDHVNVGLFNYKTGFTFIEYSRNFMSTKNDEFFAAFGTSIAVNTISVGVQKRLLESALNKEFYGAITLHGTYGLGELDDFIAPSIAVGLEIPLAHHGGWIRPWWGGWILNPIKNINNNIKYAMGNIHGGTHGGIVKKEFVNIGVSSSMRFNGEEIKFIIYPYVNLSYRW